MLGSGNLFKWTPGQRTSARPTSISPRRNRSRALRDQPVMLYAAVLGEVEHRFFVEAADLEIAFGDEDLIALAGRLRDDFTGRRDDAAAGEQLAALLVAGLGDADDPCAVLIRAP